MRDAAATRRIEGSEGEWLAWLHADGPEVDGALACEDVLDDIEVPARDARAGNEHVGVERFVDLCREVFDRVTGDAEEPRDAAILQHEGRDALGVGIVDAARQERLAGLRDFVARGKDGDNRTAVDGHLGQTDAEASTPISEGRTMRPAATTV